MLLKRWCCWCAVAEDALMLLMCWCCWCADAAYALMLLMCCWWWCADAAWQFLRCLHLKSHNFNFDFWETGAWRRCSRGKEVKRERRWREPRGADSGLPWWQSPEKAWLWMPWFDDDTIWFLPMYVYRNLKITLATGPCWGRRCVGTAVCLHTISAASWWKTR